MCTEYPMSRAYKITGSTSEAKKAVSASIFGSPQLNWTTLSNTQSAVSQKITANIMLENSVPSQNLGMSMFWLGIWK